MLQRSFEFGVNKGWTISSGSRSRRQSVGPPAGPGSGASPAEGTGALAEGLRAAPGSGGTWVLGVDSIDSMILPQVHLRKPCYDFSFL